MNESVGFCSFVKSVDLADEPIEDSYECIFDQYEKVVVQALATSFGLDFLVQDRHGGDVDTIYNVRKIGADSEMTYKNDKNAASYENRGSYDYNEYHDKNKIFATTKKTKKQEWKDSNFTPFADEYEGGKLYFTGKNRKNPEIEATLDHIVECKQIHDDPARVLAGLDGAMLANCKENYAFTNKSLNSSMGSWAKQQMQSWKQQCEKAQKEGNPLPLRPKVDMEAYIAAHPELDETTKKNMLAHYKKAKKAYDAKIARAYYTSKGFWRDTGKAAAKLGISMGVRQALGLVFTEIWFTVKDAIVLSKESGENLFLAIANAVKKGLENAKEKFGEIWHKFIEGAVAGVLSSLVTTLANIFFTTAKSAIKIIRESFASLSSACNILIVNPDGYPLGERFVAAAKVIATGASVVAGAMVNELLRKTPLATIPIVCDIVPTFCSVLVTGIMSCSFLHILDHNEVIKKAVEKLNSLPDIDNFRYSLKKQAELLTRYLAELVSLDFDKLEKQEKAFSEAAQKLSACTSEKEMNDCLHLIYKDLQIDIPWKDYDSFDDFMNDENAHLVFA